jgi:hypothetical protein
MGKRKTTAIAKPATSALQVDQLLGDLRRMIDAARLRVATAANSENDASLLADRTKNSL